MGIHKYHQTNSAAMKEIDSGNAGGKQGAVARQKAAAASKKAPVARKKTTEDERIEKRRLSADEDADTIQGRRLDEIPITLTPKKKK